MKLRGERGFTLMEMVILIAVGSVLLVGLSRAIQSQIQAAVEQRNQLVALNLARHQMAVMMNSAYPGTGTTTPSSDGAFPDFAFSQVVTNVVTSGADTVNQIQMDVSANGRVLVRLYTYRTNTASFGDGA
jgi:prepilin-type N-terminal cleavage/methylation domain-containing protein